MKRLVFLFLMLLPVSLSAQQQEITQYLPHFVAGSLPDSDWESKILFVNLSGYTNTVTIDFFDNVGNPLTILTNKGVSNSFNILLLNTESSDVLEILRNTSSFVTGWAKVHGTKSFAIDLQFQQFLHGGVNPVGKADVANSPTENVLTYPLAPQNGVAFVNPGSQDANVNFTAFNRAGNKIREGVFTLSRGAHVAMFFNQAPFFLEENGIIVISSNIPLSGIALEFDGLVFKTIPRIPTPRRLDSQRAGIKIGFWYINSNDRAPLKKEFIQARLNEAIGAQKFLLDKELPLNGLDRVELPYDLDSNGLPNVLMVQGGSRENYFDDSKVGFERIRWDEILSELNHPEDWNYEIIFADFWETNPNGGLDDIPANGGGGYFGGTAWMSALDLIFMQKSFFGNKALARTTVIPELNEKELPGFHGSLNLESLADFTFDLFNHETGHALWGLNHSDAGESNFRSMMGRTSINGCINLLAISECILLPIEAGGVSRGTISHLNDFDWIKEDKTIPIIELISSEVRGTKLTAHIRVQDEETGISSISINSIFTSPYTRFWKEIGHFDNLNDLLIEADISGATSGVFVYVNNNQGRTASIAVIP